ncbi:unnamed protein product [Prunus brigantina]
MRLCRTKGRGVGWCASATPRKGTREREHGREGEWVACEMQASSPMNSWRMFQLGVSWVHQRFKRGYISWGVTLSFGKYCEWVYKGLGFGYKTLECYIGLC